MKTNKNQHANSRVAFVLFLERLYFLSFSASNGSRGVTNLDAKGS